MNTDMKNIEDYLHFYLGCDVEVDQTEYNGTKKVWKLRGVTKKGDVTFCDVLRDFCISQSFHRTPIKPILRRLEDMTEDEFYKMVILHFGEHNTEMVSKMIKKIERRKELKQAVKYGTSIPYTGFDKDGKHYVSATLSQNALSPTQFLYALSIGIDLFNLIENNLAIDSKTLHQV